MGKYEEPWTYENMDDDVSIIQAFDSLDIHVGQVVWQSRSVSGILCLSGIKWDGEIIKYFDGGTIQCHEPGSVGNIR